MVSYGIWQNLLAPHFSASELQQLTVTPPDYGKKYGRKWSEDPLLCTKLYAMCLGRGLVLMEVPYRHPDKVIFHVTGKYIFH